MADSPRDLATALILETFRLNGRLLATGDRLVADLGLTSARWQVLGAVAMAAHPGPIAHVARSMGLARQNVRRIVGDLVEAGLLQLAPNPHHRRAPLVLLTEGGSAVFAAASARQAPWAEALTAGLEPDAIRTALAVARTLRERLEDPEPEELAPDDV
ncbi:MAG TPA: MarR family winged helix-turn-helix transcriptional regulator [Falsiroseomonas sp.]|nr:MarR family winged helix-turn-helix transcriptional regulator [Falsiroseomonas sp.]